MIMVKVIFGRGLVGVRHVPITGITGCVELSELKEKHVVGQPHEEPDNPLVTLEFETIQGLEVLISQLADVRSDMLRQLSPELRIGA